MIHVYLIRNDTDKNMHRFYQLYITPALLGEWSLVREWGRIGSPGTVRKNWFETEEQAVAEGMRVLKGKLKKGYRTIIQQ
jgi:predicted DNA-binding WGR domain protein